MGSEILVIQVQIKSPLKIGHLFRWTHSILSFNDTFITLNKEDLFYYFVLITHRIKPLSSHGVFV